MKTQLYYVVEKSVVNVDGIEECTGSKSISAYKIVDNKPYEFTTVECANDDNSADMINKWLEENGHIVDYFTLAML